MLVVISFTVQVDIIASSAAAESGLGESPNIDLVTAKQNLMTRPHVNEATE